MPGFNGFRVSSAKGGGCRCIFALIDSRATIRPGVGECAEDRRLRRNSAALNSSAERDTEPPRYRREDGSRY